MIKILSTILLALALTGCAEYWAFKGGAADHAMQASDEALKTILFTLCQGMPKGAMDRRFKTADEEAALDVICPRP